MYTVLRSAFDLRKSLERKAGTKSAGDPQPLVAGFWSEVDWWQNKSKSKQNKTNQNTTKPLAKQSKPLAKTNKPVAKKSCRNSRKNKRNKTKPHHSFE